MTETTPPAETAKSLAANLRDKLSTAWFYVHETDGTGRQIALTEKEVEELIAALESSSESLTGLKEAVEVRRETYAKSEAFLSLRAESGDAEWERKHEISMIRLEECDRFLKLIAQAQKKAPREKLIEEREQASK